MNYLVIQWPWMLALLLPVVGLAGVLARARRRRNELRARLGVASGTSERRRDGLRLAAVVMLVIALSRPGYAPERRSVSQSGRDVVFAIDVSRSMLAEDAHPSRLEAAKQGVRDALAGFGSERVGLVIYAGSATILCPLTYDYDFVRYMLEQVNPRTVDFGGTTVLSAVEKSVDNVFSDERKGMQDLVVLTDGEDHVPDAARVAGLLSERGVDLLLIGLGDPSAASRIPVVNEEGGKSYLKHDGDFVSTRLNEKVLRDLAAKCQGASFVAPGTGAFDLGGLYVNYASGKPVEGAVGADSFVVYKEAGPWLVCFALVMLIVGGRIAQSGLLLMVLAATMIQPLEAEGFEQAKGFQIEGKVAEALEIYAGLEDGSPRQVAAVKFNEGLCHLILSEKGESLEGSLASARIAQRSFLEAKRLDRGLERAGMRLDMTAGLIVRYEEELRKKQEEEQKIQEQLEAVIERLKALHEKQSGLFVAVKGKAPNPGQAKRGQPKPPAPVAPVTANKDAREFSATQQQLGAEGSSIRSEMEKLESAMMAGLPEGMPPEMSAMREPLRLMGEALVAQDQAAEQLTEWKNWATALAHQQVALRRIEEILALLEGGDSDDSGEGDDDEGEWDDEGDWDEYEDGEEGSPSSMPMEGDMAAGSEMAPLPVPNYSVEDLLMEEQGSLQFREQQRAKGQEGKVEKDW